MSFDKEFFSQFDESFIDKDCLAEQVNDVFVGIASPEETQNLRDRLTKYGRLVCQATDCSAVCNIKPKHDGGSPDLDTLDIDALGEVSNSCKELVYTNVFK